jgi:adenylate cyclase
LRFLPDIRYGTENYPEKVARRLRALNLITWTSTAVAIFFALVDFALVNFVDPKPGLWKAGMVAALGAAIWASVPLSHRFGTLWGALIFILTLYAYFFASTYLFGTDSGVQLGYLLAASLVVVLTERILLSAVLGVLAAPCPAADTSPTFSLRRATTYASRFTPSTFSLPNCRPKRSRRSANGWSPTSTRRWRR